MAVPLAPLAAAALPPPVPPAPLAGPTSTLDALEAEAYAHQVKRRKREHPAVVTDAEVGAANSYVAQVQSHCQPPPPAPVAILIPVPPLPAPPAAPPSNADKWAYDEYARVVGEEKRAGGGITDAEYVAAVDCASGLHGPGAAPHWFGPAMAAALAPLTTRLDTVSTRLDTVAARQDNTRLRRCNRRAVGVLVPLRKEIPGFGPAAPGAWAAALPGALPPAAIGFPATRQAALALTAAALQILSQWYNEPSFGPGAGVIANRRQAFVEWVDS